MDREMHKIVIITRKTRLQELVYKYNTIEQAKFYLEHMGIDFSDYVKEDTVYKKAVERVKAIAEPLARVQEIDRDFVPNMIFGKQDVVIAVGQDGLVANVMKYLDGQPLLGVNPDTARWDGVLLPFEPAQLTMILPKVLAGDYSVRDVTMARATAKDGQTMLAVNDFFIGCRTHTSARYDLQWNRERENQSSSGIIVSTGLGSTGWYKSVMAQAKRMAEIFHCGKLTDRPFCWESNELRFVVREPYPSRITQADLIYGRITPEDTFQITSKMPVNGVIFSDGMEEDAVSFNSGVVITIGIANKKGKLVVK